MSTSDPSASNTAINTDNELLAYVRMSTAQAAMYIGCSSEWLRKRFALNQLRLYDIFHLVNSALWMGTRIDLGPVRDYVERTRSTREDDAPKIYNKLSKLLAASYDKIERQEGDVIVLILDGEEVDAERIVAAGRTLVAHDPSRSGMFSSSPPRAQKLGIRYGVAEENCFDGETAQSFTTPVVLYRPSTDEFSWYQFCESGDFMAAPHNPVHPDFLRSMLPPEVMGFFFNKVPVAA